MAMSIPEEKLDMVLQERTLRVGEGSENMERGAEFSCEEWGILRDAQGSRNLVQEQEVLGISFVRIGPRKALDMLAKGINTKHGTTTRDILSLHLKTYLQSNVRLSDRNRKSSRRVRANGHAGDTRTSALGPSVIEAPSKKNIPVTRDDASGSVLWRGPAVLDSEAVSTWWSDSYMVSCPQTVRISYCGSRIVVTNVRVQPYRSNPCDLSSNFHGRNSGEPTPSREPDGSQFVDRCITTACVRKEAGNSFRVRPRKATRTEQSSFVQVPNLERTQTPLHPYVA